MGKSFKWISVLVAIIASAGCAQNNPVAPSQAPEQGNMVFALDAADNIASGQVTVTKGALTHVLPITITDHAGSVTFSGIQVGHWNILVQLFDADGVEIYTGDGTAVVTKNSTTTVTVHVNHNTGTLVINVEVPGLVLWNKLGSMDEIQNSLAGPNGVIHGSVGFSAVRHGNGFVNDTDSYVTFDNYFFNGNQGCLEFWFKPNYDCVNGIADFSTSISTWFKQLGYQSGGNGIFWMVPYHEGEEGMGVRYAIGTFDAQGEGTGSGGALVNANWIANEVHHIAFTFDRNAGFDGNIVFAVYLDGQRILGSSHGTWDNYNNGTAPFILGNLQDAVIDNIKVWDYPKTDFSDRFVE